MPSDEHASDLRTHEAARSVNFVDLHIFLSKFVEKNKLVRFTPTLANRTSFEILGKKFSYLLSFHKFCEKTVFLHKFLITTFLYNISLIQAQNPITVLNYSHVIFWMVKFFTVSLLIDCITTRFRCVQLLFRHREGSLQLPAILPKSAGYLNILAGSLRQSEW